MTSSSDYIPSNQLLHGYHYHIFREQYEREKLEKSKTSAETSLASSYRSAKSPKSVNNNSTMLSSKKGNKSTNSTVLNPLDGPPLEGIRTLRTSHGHRKFFSLDMLVEAAKGSAPAEGGNQSRAQSPGATSPGHGPHGGSPQNDMEERVYDVVAHLRRHNAPVSPIARSQSPPDTPSQMGGVDALAGDELDVDWGVQRQQHANDPGEGDSGMAVPDPTIETPDPGNPSRSALTTPGTTASASTDAMSRSAKFRKHIADTRKENRKAMWLKITYGQSTTGIPKKKAPTGPPRSVSAMESRVSAKRAGKSPRKMSTSEMMSHIPASLSPTSTRNTRRTTGDASAMPSKFDVVQALKAAKEHFGRTPLRSVFAAVPIMMIMTGGEDDFIGLIEDTSNDKKPGGDDEEHEVLSQDARLRNAAMDALLCSRVAAAASHSDQRMAHMVESVKPLFSSGDPLLVRAWGVTDPTQTDPSNSVSGGFLARWVMLSTAKNPFQPTVAVAWDPLPSSIFTDVDAPTVPFEYVAGHPSDQLVDDAWTAMRSHFCNCVEEFARSVLVQSESHNRSLLEDEFVWFRLQFIQVPRTFRRLWAQSSRGIVQALIKARAPKAMVRSYQRSVVLSVQKDLKNANRRDSCSKWLAWYRRRLKARGQKAERHALPFNVTTPRSILDSVITAPLLQRSIRTSETATSLALESPSESSQKVESSQNEGSGEVSEPQEETTTPATEEKEEISSDPKPPIVRRSVAWRLCVMRCHGLTEEDTFSHNDPFIVVTMKPAGVAGEGEAQEAKELLRTAPLEDTKNPYWNDATVDFDPIDLTDKNGQAIESPELPTVTLAVYDHDDASGDDLIGLVEIQPPSGEVGSNFTHRLTRPDDSGESDDDAAPHHGNVRIRWEATVEDIEEPAPETPSSSPESVAAEQTDDDGEIARGQEEASTQEQPAEAEDGKQQPEGEQEQSKPVSSPTTRKKPVVEILDDDDDRQLAIDEPSPVHKIGLGSSITFLSQTTMSSTGILTKLDMLQLQNQAAHAFLALLRWRLAHSRIRRERAQRSLDQKEASRPLVHIHRTVFEAATNIFDGIAATLDQLSIQGSCVTFVGHGAGGTLATLLATLLNLRLEGGAEKPAAHTVITVGSPKLALSDPRPMLETAKFDVIAFADPSDPAVSLPLRYHHSSPGTFVLTPTDEMDSVTSTTLAALPPSVAHEHWKYHDIDGYLSRFVESAWEGAKVWPFGVDEPDSEVLDAEKLLFVAEPQHVVGKGSTAGEKLVHHFSEVTLTALHSIHKSLCTKGTHRVPRGQVIASMMVMQPPLPVYYLQHSVPQGRKGALDFLTLLQWIHSMTLLEPGFLMSFLSAHQYVIEGPLLVNKSRPRLPVAADFEPSLPMLASKPGEATRFTAPAVAAIKHIFTHYSRSMPASPLDFQCGGLPVMTPSCVVLMLQHSKWNHAVPVSSVVECAIALIERRHLERPKGRILNFCGDLTETGLVAFMEILHDWFGEEFLLKRLWVLGYNGLFQHSITRGSLENVHARGGKYDFSEEDANYAKARSDEDKEYREWVTEFIENTQVAKLKTADAKSFRRLQSMRTPSMRSTASMRSLSKLSRVASDDDDDDDASNAGIPTPRYDEDSLKAPSIVEGTIHTRMLHRVKGVYGPKAQLGDWQSSGDNSKYLVPKEDDVDSEHMFKGTVETSVGVRRTGPLSRLAKINQKKRITRAKHQPAVNSSSGLENLYESHGVIQMVTPMQRLLMGAVPAEEDDEYDEFLAFIHRANRTL